MNIPLSLEQEHALSAFKIVLDQQFASVKAHYQTQAAAIIGETEQRSHIVGLLINDNAPEWTKLKEETYTLLKENPDPATVARALFVVAQKILEILDITNIQIAVSDFTPPSSFSHEIGLFKRMNKDIDPALSNAWRKMFSVLLAKFNDTLRS